MIKKIFGTPSSYKERIQIFEKIDVFIALGVICGYLFAMTICGMSVKHVSYSQITFIESLVNICFAGMVLVLVKKRGYGLDSVGLKEGNIKLSLIMGIILASIFFFCNCLINIWFEGSEFVSAKAIIMYLFYFFTVSLSDELMFRGFLETRLHALTRHIWMDVIITGILFVFIHFPLRMCAYNLSFSEFITDIPYILNLFITHLILSYIRIKSDSLYGAIIPHWVSDFAYAIASIVVFMSPWFMPVMFLIAGVSAFFSLKKRTGASFLKERFRRLGIPFLFGVIFVNPILSYVADKTHNGYNGNYFEHYAVYFTRFTDLTGYDGGFTPGHLWFIEVLMLISCIGYGIIKVIDRWSKNDGKVLCIVDCIIIVLSIISFDITFGGKKIITYLGTYLIGYYLFSKQSFIEKLMKYKGFIITVFMIVSVMNVVLCQYFISLTGMGCIYNFVLSFVISTIITSGVCFFISKITSINISIEKIT